MKFWPCFFLFLSISFSLFAESPLDSLAKDLVTVVYNKRIYDTKKQERIAHLHGRIQRAKLAEKRYSLYKLLAETYEKYQIDSAIKYVEASLAIAKQGKKQDLLDESSIFLAQLYSSGGKHIESERLLMQIDRATLSRSNLPAYYAAYAEFCSHYGQSSNSNIYFQRSEAYRDSLLSVLDKNSLSFRITLATKHLFNQETALAEQELLTLFRETADDQAERALISYLLGVIYKSNGDLKKQLLFFTQSAIIDIKHAIKDHASLQSLALSYYEEGNIDKAYLFIQTAINDAIFCNVRYRTIESSSFYPLINDAFQEKENLRKKELRDKLMVISVLSVVLLSVVLIIINQIYKLRAIRADLKLLNNELQVLNVGLLGANKELSEANFIKQEYITQFFDICSTYIDKIDSQRKDTLKKLSNKQYEALHIALKSPDFVQQELDELYKNFDIIFLNLYPSFVHDLNSLLKDDEQIIQKPQELLNTELRIFALLRLGITDSAKIAAFLRYSLRTVYNYRVKVRNKVRGDKDQFEAHIRKIGNVRR